MKKKDEVVICISYIQTYNIGRVWRDQYEGRDEKEGGGDHENG